MVTGVEHEGPGDETEGSEDEGASLFTPAEIAASVARAIRHNLPICLGVAASVCVLGGMVVAALPPVYDSTFKIFVQDRGEVTSSLASGHQARNRSVDGERGLSEFIFAHDNLLAVVREAKLIERWPDTRVLPMRLKDQLMEAAFGPPPRAGMERGFVEMVGDSILAEPEGDSVRVHTQWRDAETAYDIARVVQKNFIAARADYDLGPIRRALPFLEAQLQQADEALEAAVTRVQSIKSQAGIETSATEELEAAAENLGPSAEARRLSRQLSDVRRRQREMADSWRRLSTELKAKLIEARGRLSAEHPEVMSLAGQVRAASEVPEELAELRQEEAALLDSLGGGGASSAGASRRDSTSDDSPRSLRDGDSPELDTARARLFSALRRSNDIAERLEDARIELATAEEDFSHRYVVIEEPMVSNQPLKPKKPLLFVLVAIGSILMGALAGVGWQLRRGHLEEPWQVRALGLPLLAEVDLRGLPPPKKS